MEALSPLPDMGATITQIAGLSPAAQVAAVIMLGCIAVTWIWTRRPQVPNVDETFKETFKAVIGAMTEQSTSTNEFTRAVSILNERVGDVVDRFEQMAQQNAQQNAEIARLLSALERQKVAA